MDFVVSQACQDLGLRSGVVIFRDLTVQPASQELRAEIAVAAAAIRTRFAHPREIGSLPEVLRFQEILRAVGVNPRREQPSVERLMSLAWKRGDLPCINNLVDAYNLVSVRRRCSLGAHDLDRITLPVELRMLDGSETFCPLGSSTVTRATPGEFGYVDAAHRVLCRLDILQADESKVTTSTRNVLLIVEGTTAHTEEVIDQAFVDVIALITRYCGGSHQRVRPRK